MKIEPPLGLDQKMRWDGEQDSQFNWGSRTSDRLLRNLMMLSRE